VQDVNLEDKETLIPKLLQVRLLPRVLFCRQEWLLLSSPASSSN